MECELVPKLEPPDSPISQERLSPEFDLSSPENAPLEHNIIGSARWNNAGEMYGRSMVEGEESSKEGIRKLCLVCGDVASGLHYGVASCEACKAFFKRTIQGSIEYSCPASGSCEITRSRRKACQACRFQKCLLMGMMREGVRPDRVRGGRQKYRRCEDSPSVVIRATKVVHPTRNKTNHHHPVRNHTFENAGSKLISTLKAIESEKILASPENLSVKDELKFKVVVSDLTDKELVAIIGWVKQVPGFGDLRLADQMSLLRGTWIDIVCFNIAYRSLPYDREIVYADDFRISEGKSKLYGIPNDLDRIMRKLIIKLTEIKMNYEEYLFLKLLILFNPDVEVESSRAVQVQRNLVIEGLLEYEGHHREGRIPHRVSDLLLTLPLIVQARFVTRDYWLMIASDARISLHKLLREMLEYASL